MNKLILLALGGAASALIGTAPAWGQDQDSNAYRNASDKASADYRSAVADCARQSGHDKQVCLQQAKVDRARADAGAVEQYRNSPTLLTKARVALANAEYGLARAKCTVMSGSDKSACLQDAKSTQTTALADARSGASSSNMAAAAREDCDRMEGSAKTACLGRTASGGPSVAERAGNAAANTASTTKKAVADSVITTKVKADMVRDPDLKAMEVHVETVDGVVMLSGFVESQKEADKAVQVARSVDGVTEVKSALKIK